MKSESKQTKNARFYPCPLCGNDHKSMTTLLDMQSNRALMGWMGKNGTAKLKVLDGVLEDQIMGLQGDLLNHTKEGLISSIRDLAVKQWSLTEETAFFKSGYETGQEAADYGTLAHAWIEAHLLGKEPTLGSLPTPARLAVEGFLAWKKDNHLKVIKTEQTFYNCAMDYAGTCDVICELNGELSLGDWKTSNGLYMSHVMQDWGYAMADEAQNGDRLYKQVFVGRFGKDGSWEVKIFKRTDFPDIHLAREYIQSCSVLFEATQKWDAMFPYKKKERIIKEVVK